MKNKLLSYRQNLDKIDKKLAKLLNQRFTISKKIGQLKKVQNLEITDFHREANIFDKLNKQPNHVSLKKVYQTIIAESKGNQKDYYLFGAHLSYSYSKILHEAMGNNNYQYLETSDFIEDFKQLSPWGANITNPFKSDAYQICDELTERAKETKVVNLITKINNQYLGDNTDALAFLNMVDYYKIDFNHKNIIILGNGATSRSIIYALKQLNVNSITKIVRTLKEPEEIDIAHMPSNLSADILINTTAADVYPNFLDEPIIDINKILNLKVFIDLNYNPYRSLLYQQAKDLNISCFNGAFMLVENARLSERIWKDEDISLSNALDALGALKQKLNIVLIGQTLSGKTTIGKVLQKDLNKELIDIDELINQENTLSIKDINNSSSLKKFRALEKQVIKKASLKLNSIIIPGAGAILDKENITNLKRNGILIFLDVDIALLKSRYSKNARPLLKSIDDLAIMYQERQNLYQKAADIIIPINNDNLQTNKLIIKEYLNEFLNN